MNKYILLFLSLTSINLLSVPAIAQSTQSCVNYWVNPQTGKQECLTVTYKPSFDYIGKLNRMSKAGKKVTAKFYIEKNITVTGGISKPVRRVTTFSDGYRFENMVLIDCNNQAIAYVSEDIKLRGKLISSEKYNPPEFENISDIPDTVAHNYICNGLKIKQ